MRRTIRPAEIDERPLGQTPLPSRAVTRARLLLRLRVLGAIWTVEGLTRGLMRLAFYGSSWGTIRTIAQGVVASWFWIPASLAILALADRYPWGDDRVSRRRLVSAHLALMALLFLLDPLWSMTATHVVVGVQRTPYLGYVIGRFDFVVMMYLAVVGAAYAIAVYRQYAERQAETIRLEAELADAQLYILTMQLQPHFLFNTLHLVSELVHDDVAAARRTLENLSRLLRQSFEHASRRQVMLAEELAFLESYLDIQRSRFEGRLTTSVRVGPELRRACVPHLLLQPLVENAIRHGIARHAGSGHLTVSAVHDGARLVIRVRDDGAGLSGARGREGMGISNTRLRLQQLYGDDYRFELRTAPGGARGAEALVELPFSLHDEVVADDAAAMRAATAPQDDGAALASPLSLQDNEHDEPADDPARWPRAVARVSDPAATPPEGMPVAEFEVADEGPAARARVVSAVRWLAIWIGVAVAWTEISALNDASTIGAEFAWLRELGGNIANVGVWLLLTPVAIWLARRFRFGEGSLIPRIALHVAGAAAVAATHMVAFDRIAAQLNLADMSPLRAVAGWAMWDTLAYLTIVAFTHLGDFASWYRERAPARARLRAEVGRARVQLLRLQLQPRLLLSSLDALSSLAASDPERCDRMITRLGDLLRSMLARAGGPTSAEEELAFADALRELERAVLVDAR